MTARSGPDARPKIVDADDLPALQAALATVLTGSGRPVLPVLANDRERVLRILDELTATEQRSNQNSGPPPALVMPTSGSTGAPKLVVLDAAALTASGRATHRRLGGDGQWLLSLPASGIAGLQVITRSVLAETEPVAVAPSAPPGEIAAAAGRMTGRRYAALVPTQLHRLLAAPAGAEALAGFDAVLIGGAAAPAGLLDNAREHGIRIVTTYGMTETAGGCVYDGRPLDGVAVAVDTTGRVRIAGPTVFAGYLGRPTETAEVLSDGWFTTADLGRIDDHGTLRVLGRSDDVVVSGGVNVALPAVAERLLAHPDVQEALAVGVPDDEWGTAVVAFVTIGATTPAADTLRGWVAAELGRAHAPRRVLVIESMPMLDNGKPDRQALVRLALKTVSDGNHAHG